jgi:hypothetical protein
MHTVKDSDVTGGLFLSSPMAFEAANERIDGIYPKDGVSDLGEIE